MRLVQVLGLLWVPLLTDARQWYCGTDAFTQLVSLTTVTVADKRAFDSVNMCCFLHDRCYEYKRGRRYCDDAFCQCLHDYFRHPTRGAIAAKNATTTRNFVEEVCDLVRNFGESAYEDKGGSWFSLSAIIKWISSKISQRKNQS